jgi:hypothetical protein
VHKPVIVNGKNLSYLKDYLAKVGMDASDIERLISKANAVLEHLPDRRATTQNEQGLLLGFVQSGKTGAPGQTHQLCGKRQPQQRQQVPVIEQCL